VPVWFAVSLSHRSALRCQIANGARDEDVCLDGRTAPGGLARSGAITRTTATRRRRPDKQFATHQYRRNLPTGNGCDVLQPGQRPEQRGLRIKYGVAIEHWGRSERPIDKASSVTRPFTSCCSSTAGGRLPVLCPDRRRRGTDSAAFCAEAD